MVKNTKRILAVLLSLVLIIMNVASVYASGETDTQNDSLLIDVQNIVSECQRVLNEEYPELSRKLRVMLPDENFRRVGQSMAAASLPDIR